MQLVEIIKDIGDTVEFYGAAGGAEGAAATLPEDVSAADSAASTGLKITPIAIPPPGKPDFPDNPGPPTPQQTPQTPIVPSPPSDDPPMSPDVLTPPFQPDPPNPSTTYRNPDIFAPDVFNLAPGQCPSGQSPGSAAMGGGSRRSLLDSPAQHSEVRAHATDDH